MAERNFDEEYAFDQQEGHEFTLGGYTFHTPPVAPPGAFLEGGRGLRFAVQFLRRVVLPEERANLERVLEMSDTSATLVDLAPELLAAASMFLAAEELGDGREEARKALQDVVERCQAKEPHDGPIVSAVQLDAVAEWIGEVTIGRPTKSPSPSGTGDGRTSNGSKAASSKAARAGKN